MRQHRVIAASVTIALLALAAGCAGPLNDGGVASTEPAGLSGTWNGSFGEAAAHSRVVQGQTTLTINEDLTFTSTSPTRPNTTGRVIENGNRVTFLDSSGSRFTLARSGDTLYGVTQDTVTSAPVMVRLEREQKASDRVAAVENRLCRVAGGTYAGDTCHATDWGLAERCIARGGVYFASGDYCEVPGMGLRP